MGKCGCIPDGKACITDSDCCSNLCAIQECGCRKTGQSCLFSSDCCMGTCNGNTCS
jgi:hypothetical protein